MKSLQNFVIWLDGYLDAVGAESFNVSKTNMIKTKLYDLFEHEAEPVGETHIPIDNSNDQHNHMFPRNGDDDIIYKC